MSFNLGRAKVRKVEISSSSFGLLVRGKKIKEEEVIVRDLRISTSLPSFLAEETPHRLLRFQRWMPFELEISSVSLHFESVFHRS